MTCVGWRTSGTSGSEEASGGLTRSTEARPCTPFKRSVSLVPKGMDPRLSGIPINGREKGRPPSEKRPCCFSSSKNQTIMSKCVCRAARSPSWGVSSGVHNIPAGRFVIPPSVRCRRRRCGCGWTRRTPPPPGIRAPGDVRTGGPRRCGPRLPQRRGRQRPFRSRIFHPRA